MNSVPTRICLVLGLLAANFSGCAQETAERSDKPKQFQRLEALSDSQEQQRQMAIAAKEELFQSLLGELMASIQENGIPGSIEVCKTKAPQLADDVSDRSKLRIGRTSFQLRNPENAPPAWATSFVEERVDQEVNIGLGDASLGVLLPIHLKETCLMCHGSKEAIMPEVATAIRGRYPRDKATGFAVGDLRGYFWIEVPNQDNQ